MSDHQPTHLFETTTTTPTNPFDVMYLALRRRLLLQCFALTGDLAAARAGVGAAFVAARQQWKYVDGLERPEAWVRQRAMRATQRHHAPRPRRTVSGLSKEQASVLQALSTLKDGERKALILRHLADLGPAVIGRELALTEAVAQQRLHTAEASFARASGWERTEPERTAAALRSLAPVVTHPGLPRTPMIHHRARRRSRLQIVVSVLTAVAVAGIGGLALKPTSRSAALDLINARPLTPATLLTASQVSTALSPDHADGWQITTTDQDSAGTGLLDACQVSRYADAAPATAWVRTFKSSSTATTLVQRTEVSVGDEVAAATYATTLRWYAACTQARAHITSAATLQGVGDQAWLLNLTLAGNPAQTEQVIVARSGMITSTLVLTAPAPTAATATAALAELGRLATQNLCLTSAAQTCPKVTQATATAAVPPAVETPGMLATIDLPALAGIQRPWVGTQPVVGGINLAATACDATTFTGAVTKSRSFLIPDAGMPQSFGLTETVATYPTAAAAAAAAAQISNDMASCHQRQVDTTVDQQRTTAATPLAAATSMWHEQAQINSQRDMVSYWMGLTQVGRYLAQTTLIPAANADTNADDFAALVQRSAERLSQQ